MIVPVILAGGYGSRLWPLSRELFPKQFLPLVSNYSLLQNTILRLGGLYLRNAAPVHAPIVVCNESHRFLVADHLDQIGVQPATILLEPARRNTAPAIAIAALAALEIDNDAVMVVLPSDHHIKNVDSFVSSVFDAVALAKRNYLVTFGVVPTKPETGYGYIHVGPVVDLYVKGFVIKRFVEKPDIDTAREYVESGKYLWNSGMFAFRATRFLKDLETFDPETAFACRKAYGRGHSDLDFYRIDKETFSACASNSVDYAVMEKTHSGVVLPLKAGWCDLGSWESVREVLPKDPLQNAVSGDVLLHDVKQCTIIATHRLVGATGLRDCVVVETPDAVFISTRDKAQTVQDLVRQLSNANREEVVMHNKVHRPWGHYIKLNSESRFLTKHLFLKPGASISLQKHHHRAEHWVVVSGTASVTRGDETFLLNENESTFIPVGMVHRLKNIGRIPLELVEVQTGSYLSEDDIVRHYNAKP